MACMGLDFRLVQITSCEQTQKALLFKNDQLPIKQETALTLLERTKQFAAADKV